MVYRFSFKLTFPKNISKIISASNSLDPDQAGHFVVPDLDPNCLQWLPVVDTSRERIQERKTNFLSIKLKYFLVHQF